MERFRGTDPRAVDICNKLQDIICEYIKENTELKAILYLGAEEMYAVQTITRGDPSIDRDLVTGEVKLYGFPIVKVAKSSYAALCPSIMLNLGDD